MLARVRGEVAVAMVTALVTAIVDVAAALIAGVVTWLLLCVLRSGRGAAVELRELGPHDADPALLRSLRQSGLIQLVEAKGPLLFFAAARIDAVLSVQPPWPRFLILDLRGVTALDGTALAAFRHVIDCLEARAGQFALVCTPGTSIWATLHEAGLASRALGGTCCFTLPRALERVARLPLAPVSSSLESDPDSEESGERRRVPLRLVRSPLEPLS